MRLILPAPLPPSPLPICFLSFFFLLADPHLLSPTWSAQHTLWPGRPRKQIWVYLAGSCQTRAEGENHSAGLPRRLSLATPDAPTLRPLHSRGGFGSVSFCPQCPSRQAIVLSGMKYTTGDPYESLRKRRSMPLNRNQGNRFLLRELSVPLKSQGKK